MFQEVNTWKYPANKKRLTQMPSCDNFIEVKGFKKEISNRLTKNSVLRKLQNLTLLVLNMLILDR